MQVLTRTNSAALALTLACCMLRVPVSDYILQIGHITYKHVMVKETDTVLAPQNIGFFSI